MERRHPEQSRLEFSAPPEELLTARQVAKRLNVSVSWALAHAAGDRKPVLPRLKIPESRDSRGTPNGALNS